MAWYLKDPTATIGIENGKFQFRYIGCNGGGLWEFEAGANASEIKKSLEHKCETRGVFKNYFLQAARKFGKTVKRVW